MDIVQLFRNLDVGEYIRFRMDSSDKFVRAKCLHKDYDPIILKKEDDSGYYEIFIDGDSVLFKWYPVVH